ncbi:MAG: YkgJ family cysteine cluster protein [Thermodesulfobacteriota bacterium]
MEKERIQALPQNRAELMERWPRLLAEILEEIRSPAEAGPLQEQMEKDDRFMTLVKAWDFMPTTSQAIAWEKIQDRLWEAARATRPYCVRCGDCCRRGSPGLYNQDRPVLAQGRIKPRDLMTLRRGEPAFSNREQKIVRLDHELVKLKEAPGGRTCIFLGPGGDACLIYPDRPFQCRIMECWDPSRYDKLSQYPPLSRLDLLGQESPLAEIVRNHEEKCSVAELGRSLAKTDPKDPATQEKALNMILYDLHVREFAHEKLGLPQDEMDFIFGRPLYQVVQGFGWDVQPDRQNEPRLRRLKKPEPPKV